MRPCVNRRKIRASVGVVAEVRQERLLDATGHSQQLDDRLLEAVDIRRIRLGRRVGPYLGWNVGKAARTIATVESNDWLDYAAAEETTAVVVNVEPEVDSGAEGVLAVNPRNVIYDLRRGDRALRVGRKAVRPVDVQRRSQHAVVGPDGNFLGIRKVGVGLAEGELKREAVETRSQLVHQRWREIVPVTHGQVLAQPIHFAQRREAWIHLRPCVEEVALLRIERILQPADKDTVVGTKSMIHAHVVVRPLELGRRVPVESGLIESVTQAESVGSRQAVHQRKHCRISADALRIVGEDVVTVHAVADDRRAITHGNARLQVATGIYEKG